MLGGVGLLAMVGGLLFPGTRTSPSDADHEEFLQYQRKAERGDIHSQHNLGFCYHHGRGVKSDLKEAVKWYRKAAEQNNATAQFLLGFCYERGGRGVGRDYVEAYAWYSLAAKKEESPEQRREYLESKMTAQQIAAGQKRTLELRALIEAKLKEGGK